MRIVYLAAVCASIAVMACLPLQASAETVTGGSGAVLEQMAIARRTAEANVEQLSRRLASEPDRNVQAALCRMLGDTRNRGAIEPLLTHLTLSVTVDPERPPAWGGLPAVEALASIGIPALPRLAETIGTSDDAEARHCAALAIALAFAGAEDYAEARKLAQAYLLLKTDAVADNKQKERLLQAVKLFEGRSFIAPLPKPTVPKGNPRE